jgi:uncharacterized protein (TIGR00369 family)
VGAPALDLPTSHGCFVCGEDNRHGLRLRFRREGTLVLADCTLCLHHAGFSDRAHGGVVAALLDEAMGWATILASGRFTYTVELQVRYQKPVPLGVPLRVEASIERHTRRLSFATARLVDSPAGTALAAASGKFMMTDAAESSDIAEQLIYRDGNWRLPS